MRTTIKEKFKISVCLATYNGAAFIRVQLQSILLQLNLADEVIVSDDNSTDNTLDLIRSINDTRIRIFINHSVPGPTANFQNALTKANGDYIFLADQDDIWYNYKISKCVDLLSEYDLVLSNCRVVDTNHNIIHDSFFVYRNSKPGFWRNLYKNSYIGCCMAFRSSLLHYILPIPTTVHMHDWWIGLLAERYARTAFVSEPLMDYIRHGGNASPTGESSSYSWSQRFRNRLYLVINLTCRLLTMKKIIIICSL